MAIRSPFNCDKQIGEENREYKLRFECLKTGNTGAAVDSLSVLDNVNKPIIQVEWKSCSNVTLEKRNNNPGMYDNSYTNTAVTNFSRFEFPACKSVLGNKPWKYVSRKERRNMKDNDKRAIVKAEKSFRKVPIDVAGQNSKFNKNQKLIQQENTELLRSSYKKEESIIKNENKLKTGEFSNFDHKHDLKSSSNEKLEGNEYGKSKVHGTPNPPVTNSQNKQGSDVNSNDKLRSNETKEPELNEHLKTEIIENSKDKQHLKSTSNGRMLNNESIHNEDPTVQLTTISDNKQSPVNKNADEFSNNINEEFPQKENADTNAEFTSWTPNKQQQIISTSERMNEVHDVSVKGFNGMSPRKENEDTNPEFTSLAANKQQQINDISERMNKIHDESVNCVNGISSQKENEDTNPEFTSLAANKQQQINDISERMNKSHGKLVNSFSGQSTQKEADDTNAEFTSLTPNKQQKTTSSSERMNEVHVELVNRVTRISSQKENEDTNPEFTSLIANKQQQINDISERMNKGHGESVNSVNERLSQKTNDDTNIGFTSSVAKTQKTNATAEGIIQNEYMNKNELDSSKKLSDNYKKTTENIKLDLTGNPISNSKNSETIGGINSNPNLINSIDFTNARDYEVSKNSKNFNEKIKKESNRPELLASKNQDKTFDKNDINRTYAKTNPSLDPSIINTKNISDINNKSKIIKHIDFKATNPFACIDINNRNRDNTPVNFILPPDFCKVQKKEIPNPTQMKSLEKVKYVPLKFCENTKMQP